MNTKKKKADETLELFDFHSIEDEYDTKIAQEALNEWERDGYQTRPIKELWEECGL